MKNFSSIIDILEHSYRLYPDKEYLFDGEESITYRQLYHEVGFMASSLCQHGIKKGDRVLVCLPNWHEFVVVLFGLASQGAIAIPCNPKYKAEDIQHILNGGEIKAVFLAENKNLIDLFRSKSMELIVTVRCKSKGCVTYEDLLKLGMGQQAPQHIPIDGKTDVMTILYSSGTTGTPKGVMLTHQNLLYASDIAKKELRCQETDTIFIPVPVFHVFGLVPGVLMTILTGAKLIFMEKFKAEQALYLIEQGNVTIHLGVPTMFILELNHMEDKGYDLTSLRTGIIAGSSCPSNIVRKIRSEMGCNIKVSYGMTETSAGVTFTCFDDNERVCSETVGKAVPGTELKIVDENNKEVSVGEIGEIACRGLGVMKGYHNMPEKTREVMDSEGWYYTGDLATVNENGYYTIVGRKKEMISRGGYKIYPREIEEILYRHPGVLDVAIVGIPDPVLGEISCACIKEKKNYYVSEEMLKSFLADKVVKYKIPDWVLFFKDFPLNHNGKIRKDKLTEMAIEQVDYYLKQFEYQKTVCKIGK